MNSVIKNFANLIEETKDSCDCAIIIILSHGGNGKIYAVDELALDVSQLIRIIENDNNEHIDLFKVDEQIISVFDDHLIGKPKLFILSNIIAD